MFRYFDICDAQVFEPTRVLETQDVFDLFDGLRADLIVNIAQTFEGGLGGQSFQDWGKSWVFQPIVVEVHFFYWNVWDLVDVFISLGTKLHIV